MQRKMQRISTVLFVACALFADVATAHGSEDIGQYRHAIMEAMANHAAAYQMIATGKVDARRHLQQHADAIANLSGELGHLFPEGSGEGETEALPTIWEEPEKFSAAIEKMQEAAAALSTAAGSKDDRVVMSGLATAGKACKGCHESFRAEDEEHEDSDSH